MSSQRPEISPENATSAITATLRGVNVSTSPTDGWLILAALLPSWLALAWLVSKAQWFWNHRPDLQFGWIVLLLSAFLIWDGWGRKPQPRFKSTFPAIFLLVPGVLLLFLVQIYMAAFGMMAASLLGLALGVFLLISANLLFVFGTPGLRHFAFAFAFLLIALPMPSAIHGLIVNGLQGQIAAANVELLNVMGIPAMRVGSLIHLPNGTVGVDEACSGIRSLQSTVMATLFIGYLTLKNRGLQVMLFISGILLAIFGNLLRSLFLSYTANAKGVAAIDTVHDAAGWSILLFTAFGVAILAWLFNKIEAKARLSYSLTFPEKASV